MAEEDVTPSVWDDIDKVRDNEDLRVVVRVVESSISGARWNRVEGSFDVARYVVSQVLDHLEGQENVKLKKVLELHKPIKHIVFEPTSEYHHYVWATHNDHIISGDYREVIMCGACGVVYPCATVKLIDESEE